MAITLNRRRTPTLNRSASRQRHRNAGVMMPIAAVMMPAILAWIGLFWINTGLICSVKAQLQMKTKNLFQYLNTINWVNIETSGIVPLHNVLKAEFSSTAASGYTTRLKPPSRVRLTRVWIIFPTMPSLDNIDKEFTLEGGITIDRTAYPSGYAKNKHFKNFPRQVNDAVKLSDLMNWELDQDNSPSCADIPGFEGLKAENGGDGDCLVFGNTDFEKQDIPPEMLERLQANFPSIIFDHAEHAGNTIIILIQVEVQAFFPWLTPPPDDKPRLTHAMGYWKPVSTRYPLRIEREKFPRDYPGLVIAVAPQMTTDRRDPRFRFPLNQHEQRSSESPNGAPDPRDFTRIADYDPFKNFTPGQKYRGLHFEHRGVNMAQRPSRRAREWERGYWDQLEDHPKGKFALAAPDDYTFIEALPTQLPSPDPTPNIRPISYTSTAGNELDKDEYNNPDNPSDYAQMLTACMNPAILVRNMFLTSLVELAARHGQLRSTTEVLLVGSRYQLAEENVPLSAPPTIMVPAGIDILRPFADEHRFGSFQLPYISTFSNTGKHVEVTGPKGEKSYPGKNGWIAPWKAPLVPWPKEIPKLNEWKRSCYDPETGQNWCPHHALVAEQLRMCWHLYDKIINTRPYPRMAELHDRYFTEQYGLWGRDYLPRLKPAKQTNIDRLGWDQDCPFGPATPYKYPWLTFDYFRSSNCKNGGGADIRFKGRTDGGLTASQLVSILGSVQPCPYSQHYQLDHKGDYTLTCLKDFPASEEPNDRFIPDFRGLAKYFESVDREPEHTKRPSDYAGLLSPGLFPPPTRDTIVIGNQAPRPYAYDESQEANKPLENEPINILPLYHPEKAKKNLRPFSFGFDPKQARANRELPPLVIVTHEPPPEFVPKAVISKKFTRVVVIYIPTRKFATKADTYDYNGNGYPQFPTPGAKRIAKFFGIDNVRRFLIVIDPFAQGILTRNEGDDDAKIAEQVRDYWLELVLPGSSNNQAINISWNDTVYRKAVFIFNQLITTTQRKY